MHDTVQAISRLFLHKILPRIFSCKKTSHAKRDAWPSAQVRLPRAPGRRDVARDTIDELRRIDKDLGRAIVVLVNTVAGSRKLAVNRPIVTYEKVGRRRSLIVIDRDAVRGMPGCELIPVSEDRAFISLRNGRGLPHLEVAILDRLADHNVTGRQREGLEALQRALLECRRANDIEVESRSIFVVKKSARPRHAARPLR